MLNEKILPVIAAAVDALSAENISQHAPSDLLFLAWRQAYIDEWAEYEKRLNQMAVQIAKKMAADQADRIVFRQPLAYQKDLAGKEWLVRDMFYLSAPFWFVAYYEIVREAIEGPSDNLIIVARER